MTTIDAVKFNYQSGNILDGKILKPEIKSLAEILQREYVRVGQLQEPTYRTLKRAYPKIGRNELCPCCSGKKFKACHGR